MKKYLMIFVMTVCVLMLAACGKKEKYTIEILVPAGSTEAFVYSEEEINPIGNKIKIWAGAGLSDTEVILKPVTDKIETGYVAEYLTHGVPVEFDVDNEKDQWFKIGVSVQNDSDRGSIAVSVEVEGVEVRIAERDEVTFEAKILEIHDNYYLVEPVEGSQELKSADKIEVPIKMLDPSLEPEVGDVVEIIYDGVIMERYPAILHEVYSIKVADEAENTGGAPLAPTETDLDLESVSHIEVIVFHDKTFNKSDLSKETIEWLEWYNDLSEDEQLSISYIPSDLYEICGYPTAEDMVVEETITYNGKEYKTSELCNDTLYWLGLSKQERMFSSYLPPEFMEFEENYGITLSLEDITATGATIKCEQSGGEATGELQTGSWYIIERWTQMDGWKEVETVLDKQQVGWTAEAYMILEGSTSEWEVNWEWLYGELPVGKYRIGKQIMDWRTTGDYDTVVYHVPFEIK